MWSSEEMSSMSPSDWIDTNQKKSGSNAAIHGTIRGRTMRSCGRIRRKIIGSSGLWKKQC
jgi:hypothetical protein